MEKRYYNQDDGLITWDKLPMSIKDDIIENLMSSINYLQVNYWDSKSLRDMIDSVIKQPKFEIQLKNVDDLYNELEELGWFISENNVKYLIGILQSDNELDPVLLNSGKFYDGGHRLVAYKRLRKDLIPTIDINFMLTFDWEKWDNGEVDF